MNELGLLAHNDVPFPQGRVTLHQPSVKEIGYIGEEYFFTGCQVLTFTKDRLIDEDKSGLENASNFDILMTIVRDKNPQSQQNVNCMKMVLALLFPDYTIQILPQAIALIHDKEVFSIDANNYNEFQQLIKEMFCLDRIFGQSATEQYDPANAAAQKLVEKFRKRHQKLREIKNNGQKVTIISRYISILAVGENKDLNSLANYSVYQLFDEFERFNLKQASDIYIQAKMAGAQDLKEVKNWMSDLNQSDDS